MNGKQILILTLFALMITLMFISSINAQVWNIEFSPNITPVVSKVSEMVRENYLEDDHESNKNSFGIKNNKKDAENSAAIFEISIGEKNQIGTIIKNASSILKKVGFSSIDDVHTAAEINRIGKIDSASPITIGSPVEDVIRAMGTPEFIQESPNAFKYRYSYIYFDYDWKVQSWVNKGNLKVSWEEKKAKSICIDQSLFDNAFGLEKRFTEKKVLEEIDRMTLNNMIAEFLEFLKKH